jgi:hypothetical protein
MRMGVRSKTGTVGRQKLAMSISPVQAHEPGATTRHVRHCRHDIFRLYPCWTLRLVITLAKRPKKIAPAWRRRWWLTFCSARRGSQEHRHSSGDFKSAEGNTDQHGSHRVLRGPRPAASSGRRTR